MLHALVSGAGGFVGSRIMQQLDNRLNLTAFPKGWLTKASGDEVIALIKQIRPDVILHTAAISDTGYSAAHPEESYRANVLLPLQIAAGARKIGAKLLAFSSDQVYSGMSGSVPSTETDRLHPANLYGRQKLECEQRILEMLPDAVLLRATWMYDFPGYGLSTRGNLLVNLIRSALHGESPRFSTADLRGVTYVRQAVDLLVPAIELPGGVYNYGSENTRNMYQTACDFRDALGLRLHVEKDDTGPLRNLAMNCDKLRKHGICFDGTIAGVRRCLADYGLTPSMTSPNTTGFNRDRENQSRSEVPADRTAPEPPHCPPPHGHGE